MFKSDLAFRSAVTSKGAVAMACTLGILVMLPVSADCGGIKDPQVVK